MFILATSDAVSAVNFFNSLSVSASTHKKTKAITSIRYSLVIPCSLTFCCSLAMLNLVRSISLFSKLA